MFILYMMKTKTKTQKIPVKKILREWGKLKRISLPNDRLFAFHTS